MRRLLLVPLFSCALVFLGCPKKGGDAADGGADAAAEAEAPAAAEVVDAAPAPIAINAKNVADVARFPGETAVTDDDSKLARITPAQSAPRGGKVVATLKPGG